MIELKSVGKSFDGGKNWAVRDVSFKVEEGETLILLGSSGCGKTTTLKTINRLIEPTEGQVLLDGKDAAGINPVELKRSIGYVFQGIGLFPHKTVEENVAIVLKLLGRPKEERTERAKEMMELVDLPYKEYSHRFPDELSGGQKQRVGVARALAAKPKYMLMDEPFGALDAVTRDSLQQELIKLREKLKKTIVFVTHDILEALTLADRIAVLHDGKLEQVGTADDLAKSPASDFVHDLFAKPARQLKKFEEVIS